MVAGFLRTMFLLKLLGVFLLLLCRAFATDDGLTTAVTWDPYSLSVNGERVFIYSAEFHYQRLPVPELWLDVFQKFRANGFNAIRYIRNPYTSKSGTWLLDSVKNRQER